MQGVFHTLDDNGNTPQEQQIIKERPSEVQKAVSQLPAGQINYLKNIQQSEKPFFTFPFLNPNH